MITGLYALLPMLSGAARPSLSTRTPGQRKAAPGRGSRRLDPYDGPLTRPLRWRSGDPPRSAAPRPPHVRIHRHLRPPGRQSTSRLEIYEGLLAVQHRGQDAAGHRELRPIRFHVKKGLGLVIATCSTSATWPGCAATSGSATCATRRSAPVVEDDVQPFHLDLPDSAIAMAHNGNVTNFAELTEKHTKNRGTRLNSGCDLEIILFVFARALNAEVNGRRKVEPQDVFRAIGKVFEEVKGAYSVVATLPDVGLVAFRDPYGIKPICLGERRRPPRASGSPARRRASCSTSTTTSAYATSAPARRCWST